jgi:DNA polymerase elongation subunit (family B)
MTGKPYEEVTAKLDAKLLVLDIETRPALVYAWKGFKENIGVDQIVEPDGILCVGAKWVGGESYMFTDWEHGHVDMLRRTAKLIEESDAVIGVNHERFDIPWLMAEFARYNVPAPPKPTNIDLQKYWRRGMRFFSNKLAYVGPLLVGERKMDHEGFMLWRKVMEGDKEARQRMVDYCAQDVQLTEDLYIKLRQYLPNHPYLANTKKDDCPNCGSNHVHISKYRRTKTMRIQQLHCQSCGSYFDGKREKMT